MAHPTVVFVCTGNTCRSPLAMALARELWPGVPFVSAGVRAVAGQPAAELARAVAAERGADLDGHRSRPVDHELLSGDHWLIGMTRSHVAQLNRVIPEGSGVKVGLLGAPGEDLRGRPTPAEEEVADPIGGSLETYRTCADQLARLLGGWREVFAGPSGGGGGS